MLLLIVNKKEKSSVNSLSYDNIIQYERKLTFFYLSIQSFFNFEKVKDQFKRNLSVFTDGVFLCSSLFFFNFRYLKTTEF